MSPSLAQAVGHARAARRSVLVGLLDGEGVGLAVPGVLRAEGPDAARFLQSQLTDDVAALGPGEGHLGTRVQRTGHLLHLFSVHRLPEPSTAFRLVLEAAQVEPLRADLDAFLFADQATLAAEGPLRWIALVGPRAPEVLEAVVGPLGFEPWSTLPEGALRSVRRARGGLTVPEGTFAIRRSLGGDLGFLLAFPGEASLDAWRSALAEAVPEGGAVVDGAAFSAALEHLRIEAGQPRIGPDTAGRRRLLPETGLEQATVSYTKGCYLGQEVIARVRTYGSVPFLLRALLVGPPGEPSEAVLATLPAPGAELLTPEGTKLGQLGTAGYSAVLGRHVALAYLAREHRTPGRALTFVGPEGAVQATVALLPLFSAPDAEARKHQTYDAAIRTFADGDADAAVAMLEEVLQLDPGFGDAFEAIGVILGRSGRYHEAIDVFRRLEEVAPDEPMVHTNLSLYYMKLGDKQTAEDEAVKATLKSMNRAAGKRAAKVDDDLLEAKRRDAGRKRAMFEKILVIDPEDPIALFGLGNALVILDEPARAEEVLAKAVTVDPKNSPVYASRGRALEALERWDEAVAVYKAGVEVASRKGDLMPLKEMEHRLLLLGGR